MSKACKELKDLFMLERDWNVLNRSDFEVLTEVTELLEGRKFQEIINNVFEYVQEEEVIDIQLFCLYLQAYFNLNNSADDFNSIFEVLEYVLSKYNFISPINKKTHNSST